jgi:hypothetical protein
MVRERLRNYRSNRFLKICPLGSLADLRARIWHVRFAAVGGHAPRGDQGPLSDINRLHLASPLLEVVHQALARVGARARGKLGGPWEAYSRSGLRSRSGALDRRSLKKA